MTAAGAAGGDRKRVPVAIGSDKDLRAFLKEIDYPGACILGASGANELGAGRWELVASALHYTLPHSVHTLVLPESAIKGTEVVTMHGAHMAVLHSEALEGAPPGPRDGEALMPMVEGAPPTDSPVVNAFLRDIPALQAFLARFLTDPNMLPEESKKKPRVIVADYLKTKSYVLDLDPGGQGLRLHLRRNNVEPGDEPPGGLGASRDLDSPGRGPFDGAGPSVVYDTFLVRPSFNKGQTLACVVSYSTTEPPEHRKRLHRKKEVLGLSATVTDVVSLAESAIEDQEAGCNPLRCLAACLGRGGGQKGKKAKRGGAGATLNAGDPFMSEGASDVSLACDVLMYRRLSSGCSILRSSHGCFHALRTG
jgi:hypothetical protein